MSKVKRITVSNLKAVTSQSANFDGCTAIITGGNNRGKTTFLRSLFDRVRGTKPDAVLKQGETEGFAECELTTGEKLKWEFNDKGKGFKEKLTYTTEKDIKTSLTGELRAKLLPPTFDVDRFLQDQPKKQRETLQKLVGLDFSDIDARYKTAYEDREVKNRRANELKILVGAAPDKVDHVDLSVLVEEKEVVRKRLSTLYLSNKADNDKARKLWMEQCEDIRNNIEEFNRLQQDRACVLEDCQVAYGTLKNKGYQDNSMELDTFMAGLKKTIEPSKTYTAPAEPTYIQELPDNKDLLAIEDRINIANETNRQAQLYTDYLAAKQRSTDASAEAGSADVSVKAIETERMNLIKSAKMPEGFGFSEDGITYNGLSFTKEQLSSSGIYIAALKLAAMTLGEIKTLHFDASFLDKNSLSDIEKWADAEGLQLLIERPDFEGGEIEYQILSV